MEIRHDLGSVSGEISRLIKIGNEYKLKDQYWSHLKNNEDWARCIYPITNHEDKRKLETIYSTGRDMALFLSETLNNINYDFTEFPNLTSIVRRFDKTSIFASQELTEKINEAQETSEKLSLGCWALDEMLRLLQEQINLSEAVINTLNLLEESDLFKRENGIPIPNGTAQVIIGDVKGSNVSINSQNIKQEIQNKKEVFESLIEEIKKSQIDNKQVMITLIETMQNSPDKESLQNAYQQLISNAANHMAIIAPFLPAISGLLA